MLVQRTVNCGLETFLLLVFQLCRVDQDWLHILVILEPVVFAVFGSSLALLSAIVPSLLLVLWDFQLFQSELFPIFDELGNLVVKNHLFIDHFSNNSQYLFVLIPKIDLSFRDSFIRFDDDIHDFETVNHLNFVFRFLQLEVTLVELTECQLGYFRVRLYNWILFTLLEDLELTVEFLQV